jgi:hypothetical protein
MFSSNSARWHTWTKCVEELAGPGGRRDGILLRIQRLSRLCFFVIFVDGALPVPHLAPDLSTYTTCVPAQICVLISIGGLPVSIPLPDS